MQASELQKLFPDAASIPKEFDLTSPIEQREYLVNGEMRQWSGKTQDVWSPIYIKTDKGRVVWGRWRLVFPIIGNVIYRATLGRFARSFGMMLKAGVPMTSALTLVADAVDNEYMGEKIRDMRRNIERGESLLRVSQQSQMFTPLVLQMLAVGEETGAMDDMLSEVAGFYEREVAFDLKSLTAKIEPILISIVAVMVLILALGIFTPMWDMLNAYKGGAS